MVTLNPYFAVGKCAADARRQWCSCISIPQAIENKADAVQLPTPCGEEKARAYFAEARPLVAKAEIFFFLYSLFCI